MSRLSFGTLYFFFFQRENGDRGGHKVTGFQRVPFPIPPFPPPGASGKKGGGGAPRFSFFFGGGGGPPPPPQIQCRALRTLRTCTKSPPSGSHTNPVFITRLSFCGCVRPVLPPAFALTPSIAMLQSLCQVPNTFGA